MWGFKNKYHILHGNKSETLYPLKSHDKFCFTNFLRPQCNMNDNECDTILISNNGIKNYCNKQVLNYSSKD